MKENSSFSSFKSFNVLKKKKQGGGDGTMKIIKGYYDMVEIFLKNWFISEDG